MLGTARPMPVGRRQQPLHLSGRHVPLEHVAIDGCRLAAAKTIRHAQTLAFDGGTVDFDHSHRETSSAHMFDPGAAAAAVRALEDLHLPGGHDRKRRLSRKHGKRPNAAEEKSPLHGMAHSLLASEVANDAAGTGASSAQAVAL